MGEHSTLEDQMPAWLGPGSRPVPPASSLPLRRSRTKGMQPCPPSRRGPAWPTPAAPWRSGAQFTPRAPAPGQLVHVRQRRYLVEETVPLRPQATPRWSAWPASTTTPRASRSRSSGSARWTPRSRGGSLGRLGAEGFDRPQALRSLPAHPPMELRHRHRPSPFQSPFRAGIRLDAYQLEPLRKALLLPREPLHRRRRRAWQDHRGRAHRARAAAAPEGPTSRRRLPALGAPPVAGRDGGPLRPYAS